MPRARTSAAFCVLALAFLDSSLGLPGGVSTNGGWLMNATDIQSGDIKVPFGKYIVGLQDGANKTLLLEEMSMELGWIPTSAFSGPMFAGMLGWTPPNALLWLLAKEEVKYIETYIPETTYGDIDAAGELPAGVSVHGVLHATADIESGTVQMATGSYIVTVDSKHSYIVGVDSKAALLSELATEFSWSPTGAHSYTRPKFTGLLSQEQMLWLLNNSKVKYINSNNVGAFRPVTWWTTAGDEGELPAGVSVDGTVHTLADIESGIVTLSSLGSEESYIVGVATENKAALLLEMEKTSWACRSCRRCRGCTRWRPTLPYSDKMPMFVGKLDQTQLLWLLRHSKVKYIESDGEITIAYANDTSRPPMPAPAPTPKPLPVSSAASFAQGGTVPLLLGIVALIARLCAA